MRTVELVIVAALLAFAVYKQIKVRVVVDRGRFRLALIYVVAGVVVGVAMPRSVTAFGLLAASLLVSVAVGLARGAFTHVWRGPDGRVRSRGNSTTIALFVALVASKFVIGAVADGLGIHESSTGEILLMIAVSVAVQAEVVWRRARELEEASWPQLVVTEVGVAA